MSTSFLLITICLWGEMAFSNPKDLQSALLYLNKYIVLFSTSTSK